LNKSSEESIMNLNLNLSIVFSVLWKPTGLTTPPHNK